MDVAIEGATQADRAVLPALVGLKVEAKICPAVLQTQAERCLHLQEHGRQLLDVHQVWGSGVRRRVTFSNSVFHILKTVLIDLRPVDWLSAAT